MLLLPTACNTAGKIPNIRFYKEIPFIDAPEGVYFDSFTHDKGFIKADEWAKKRALMVMIDPDGVAAIKLQWAEACRYANLTGNGLFNQQKCNASLNSVMDVLSAIDEVAAQVLKAQQLKP